uniref:Photosystem I reaction center subunit III n=1 Tax=Bangiopsis subsimplex TaxID=139980 RepID=A0A1C9CCM2_9RHOD|nr:photosystem I subunit III [Bangiopsis subsimplex]AOM66125.1 photosystem I subunit III [Bangiopsis subsimplex]ARO90318.1 photosystem I subunit III [Bangiopsis subsimplex]
MKKFLGILFASIIIFPSIANASLANLTPCKDSAAFNNRLNASVKKLQGRLAKYETGTPPAIALEQKILQTKQRFEKYSKAGLLCGSDGLPHLIADGRWSHAVEFTIPGLLFLYITGWIGWAGRGYVQAISTSSKPAEKEIIIDVPLALEYMLSGFLWPLAAWQEFTTGKLLASNEEIPISPR